MAFTRAEISARYKARHPERIAAYYLKNKDMILKQSAEWARANPEKRKIIQKKSREKEQGRNGYLDWSLKRKYGIGIETYNAMLSQQGGVCAICKLDCARKKRGLQYRPLDVDHNAKTGKVRGLLCNACNLAIGFLKEKEDNLQAAILYLRRTNG